MYIYNPSLLDGFLVPDDIAFYKYRSLESFDLACWALDILLFDRNKASRILKVSRRLSERRLKEYQNDLGSLRVITLDKSYTGR